MTYFDWRKFLTAYNLNFVERGPNTMSGHLTIKCPLCSDDPSQHLNVNTNPRRPGWSCLRDSRHLGRDPTYLVQALLKCSHATAKDLVEQQRPSADEFSTIMDKLMTSTDLVEQRVAEEERRLEMPEEFKPITEGGYGTKFMNYLHSRGFRYGNEILKLVYQYDLRYCLTGSFKWRLIIPFYDCEQLVGWTGRHIGDTELRYLTLPSTPQEAEKLRMRAALTDPSSFVWRRDLVEKGNRGLFIVEGPMDVLKVDLYKQRLDVTVTCLFGKPKPEQVQFLGRCARKYEVVVVMLDSDTPFTENLAFADQLEELGGSRVEVLSLGLPDGVKDPGKLTPEQVREVMHWF